jgi:putative DNA primase/helicase
MSMLSEALDYAKRGWYVFPCREKSGNPYNRNGEMYTPMEKTPYTYRGLDDASTDETQIKEWWRQWPDAMIGVNAGKSG